MPDTPENQADFPQLDSQKAGLGFPIARMVVLISLATGAVLDYSLGAYQGKGIGIQQLPQLPLFTTKLRQWHKGFTRLRRCTSHHYP
jgi:hypothetical protein